MELALVSWINSFECISRKIEQLTDLSSGVILYEIIADAIPTYCDLSLLKRDSDENWLLSLQNLERIQGMLNDFFENELGLPNEATESSADLKAIAKEQDVAEILILIELVLGVIVECANKTTYIARIMELDPSSQHQLMIIIERTIQCHQNHSVKTKINCADSFESIENALLQPEGQDALGSHITEPEETISTMKLDQSVLQSENEHLLAENDKLRSAVTRFEHTVNELEARLKVELVSGVRKRSYSTNQISTVVSRQTFDENQILWQEQLQSHEDTISSQKKKIDELEKAVKTIRELKDELDLAKEEARDHAELKRRLEKLSKKNEENTELKARVRTLELQETTHIRKIMSMEEEIGSVSTILGQMDNYKKQVASLTLQTTQLKNAKTISENTIATLKEEVADHLKTIADLENINNFLKKEASQYQADAEVVNLSATDLSRNLIQSQDGNAATDLSLNLIQSQDGNNSEYFGLPTEIKEKLIRMETLLNAQSTAGQCDDVTTLKNENLQLKIKLDDAQRLLSAYENQLPEIDELKQLHKEVTEENESLLLEAEKLKKDRDMYIEQMNNLLAQNKQRENENENIMKLHIIENHTKLKNALERINTLSNDKITLIKQILSSRKQTA